MSRSRGGELQRDFSVRFQKQCQEETIDHRLSPRALLLQVDSLETSACPLNEYASFAQGHRDLCRQAKAVHQAQVCVDFSHNIEEKVPTSAESNPNLKTATASQATGELVGRFHPLADVPESFSRLLSTLLARFFVWNGGAWSPLLSDFQELTGDCRASLSRQ
jgi:hypothetical protein